jgi:D-alanyl-D-alanine carboxypeptidase
MRRERMRGWLEPAIDYIATWIAFQRKHIGLPGISIAIGHGEDVLLDASYGAADLRTGARLTPKHRFRVASHSKTFTATGVMKLVEAGAVRLDDPAGNYIDGLAPDIAAATLAQLLSHTGGVLRDGTDAGQWADRRNFRDERELRADLTHAPTIAANTRMKYSNHGFGLLGLVIAAVTGEPYTQWIAREVVAAAGLRNTYPDAPVPKGVPFSSGHSGRVLLGERLVIPATNKTHALASATGFVSTASDLVRFFGQLDPAARKSLLGVRSRRELTRRQWRVPGISIEQYYGLGTIHGTIGDWAWFGHSGGFQGFITHTGMIPAQRLAVSILTNAVDGAPAVLFDGCVRILQAFAKHGRPLKSVADWRGRWWSLWGASDLVPMGNIVCVGMPALANPFADAAELTVGRKDTAVISKAGGFGSFGEPARLIRNRSGKVTDVWLAASRLRSERAMAAEMRKRYRL